jgi:hypothetical protein
MAGFDSESGPGIGQAIKEAGLAGKLVATCVDAEPQHSRRGIDLVLARHVQCRYEKVFRGS